MLITSACGDGGSPIDPPSPPPPVKTVTTATLRVVMGDESAVPADVTLTVTDRNYSKVVYPSGGKFTVNIDSIAPFTGDTVELMFSAGNGAYNSFKRVHVDSLKNGVVGGAVLAPLGECIEAGPYAKKCIDISLAAAFDGVSDGSSFYGYTQPTLGPLPIKVAFSPELLGDSARVWVGLRKIAAYLGKPDMYVPAEYGEVIDSVPLMPGYFQLEVHGLAVLKSTKTHAGSIADAKGRIVGSVFSVSKSSDFDSPLLFWLWRTLGPRNTCSWASVLSPCKYTAEPSIEDVSYTLYMYKMRNVQIEQGLSMGVVEAWHGYLRANSLPIPQ
jgi:hypothetical protein